MKKTFTINLGGLPFIIDEDAYQLLHSYLETIKQKFHSNEEAGEIMQDIEARFAELFTQYLKGKKEVVGIEEVEAATTAMGKPEEIAGEPADTASSTHASATNAASNTQKVKRKLFRNPDEKVIGGVLSGLSVYLGIEDPIWLRVLFVALFVFGLGTTFWVYVILWMIMPEAKTASDKLQMRGEPVNLDNIQKEVTEAASRITKWGKDESIGEKFLGILALLLRSAFKVVAVLVALLVVFILFVFVASSVGFLSFASIPSVQELANVYAENTTVAYTAMLGLFLIVVAPLLSILYAAIRLIVGVRTRIPAIKWLLSGSFLVGVLLLVYAGVSFGINFKSHGAAAEKFQLMQPVNNVLFVQLADSTGVAFEEGLSDTDEENFGIFINGEAAMTRTGYKIGKPHIKLMPSLDSTFYIERYVTAKGKTKAAAINNAKSVNYNFTQTDTVLNLNTYFEVKKGGKWRAQDLYFRIAIPEGKQVRFAGNIDYVPATVKDNSDYNSTLFANTTWTTKNGKIVCLNCKEELSMMEQDFEQELEEVKEEFGSGNSGIKKKVIISTKEDNGTEKVVIESTDEKGEKHTKIMVKEKK